MRHISRMSSEECAIELVIMELSKLFQKTRKAYQKAQLLERQVYKALEDMCIDLETPTKAENADILDDAITCYFQYGEYGLKNLLKEIRAQYTAME